MKVTSVRRSRIRATAARPVEFGDDLRDRGAQPGRHRVVPRADMQQGRQSLAQRIETHRIAFQITAQNARMRPIAT